jgi:radical SAM superfamily enzyme YgiQ (UPF0313 family)
MMSMMKNAGCYSIGFEFESGSDKLLKAMNKGVTRAQNMEILDVAGEIDMHLKIQLMSDILGRQKRRLARRSA